MTFPKSDTSLSLSFYFSFYFSIFLLLSKTIWADDSLVFFLSSFVLFFFLPLFPQRPCSANDVLSFFLSRCPQIPLFLVRFCLSVSVFQFIRFFVIDNLKKNSVQLWLLPRAIQCSFFVNMSFVSVCLFIVRVRSSIEVCGTLPSCSWVVAIKFRIRVPRLGNGVARFGSRAATFVTLMNRKRPPSS